MYRNKYYLHQSLQRYFIIVHTPTSVTRDNIYQSDLFHTQKQTEQNNSQLDYTVYHDKYIVLCLYRWIGVDIFAAELMWHEEGAMHLCRHWLACTMMLMVVYSSKDINGDFYYSTQDVRASQQNMIARHHHRHRHKEEIDTFTYKNGEMHDPLLGYSDKDWQDMSNDQVNEIKDKKHYPHWPIKREAVIEGDVVLGGLMMVHERSDNMTCGPVMPQGGVQALETMLYTLDYINKELRLLPGVSIGAHILDDCDKDTYGLEMAVDFIKGLCYTLYIIVFAMVLRLVS